MQGSDDHQDLKERMVEKACLRLSEKAAHERNWETSGLDVLEGQEGQRH